MAKASDLFNTRLRILLGAEDAQRARIQALGQQFMADLYGALLGPLDTTDGYVTSTDFNLLAASRVDRIFDGPPSRIHDEVVKVLGRQVPDIATLQLRYYTTEGGDAAHQAITEQVRGFMYDRLGLSTSGSVLSGGYLDQTIQDRSFLEPIRQVISKGVASGQRFDELVRDVKALVQGTDDNVGTFKRYYKTQLFDALQSTDAQQGKLYADRLKMDAARYVGGIVENTRRFCCERNGLVFTREEMQAMNRLSWSGKKGPVETDRGGYECIHQWRWIANVSAIRYRPDLELDQDGRLVSRAGAAAPPLNSGCPERSPGSRPKRVRP